MKPSALLPLLLVLAGCDQRDEGEGIQAKPSSQARFYSGCARSGEFVTPETLPDIPPSFDEDVR